MKVKNLLFVFGLSVSTLLSAQTISSVQAVDSLKTKPDSIVKPTVTAPQPPVAPQPAAPVANNKPSEGKSYGVDVSNTLSKGTYIRLAWVNPSSSYMSNLKETSTSTGNIDVKSGYNLQIGTQYYIGPVIARHLRFGLDLSWIDFSYSKLDVSNGHSALISAIGVGPLISYAPFQQFALSTYVKAVPTYAVSVDEEQVDYPSKATNLYPKAETVGRGGFCVAGLWGIEARYSLIDLGFELKWGKANHLGELGTNVEGDIDNSISSYKINNARFFIGVRF
jgi:hypothetical protein